MCLQCSWIDFITLFNHFSGLVAIFKTSFSYYSEKKGNPGNEECRGQLLLFFFFWPWWAPGFCIIFLKFLIKRYYHHFDLFCAVFYSFVFSTWTTLREKSSFMHFEKKNKFFSYPTVVMVTTAHQKASGMLLNLVSLLSCSA